MQQQANNVMMQAEVQPVQLNVKHPFVEMELSMQQLVNNVMMRVRVQPVQLNVKHPHVEMES